MLIIMNSLLIILTILSFTQSIKYQPNQQLTHFFPQINQLCNNQLQIFDYRSIQSEFNSTIDQIYNNYDLNNTNIIQKLFPKYPITSNVNILSLLIIIVFLYWIQKTIVKLLKKINLIKNKKFDINEKTGKTQNKIIKVLLKIFLLLIFISIIIMVYSSLQTNVKKLINTGICTYSAINAEQIIKESQKYIRYYEEKYKNIKPLVIENSTQRLKDVAFYSEKLLKLINQQQLQQNNRTFIAQLIETTKYIKSLSLTSVQYNRATKFYNETIQIVRETLQLFQYYRVIITKYLNNEIQINKISEYIQNFFLIIMLSFIIFLVYIAFNLIQLYTKNDIFKYTNSHSLPFILFIITIVFFSMSLGAAWISQAGNWAYFPKEQPYGDKQYLKYHIVLRDSYQQVIKLLFNEHLNIKDIYKGQLYNLTPQFQYSLSYFQQKQNDFLQKLFTQAEKFINPNKLESQIYNYYYVHRLLFDKQYAKFLMINIKKSFKAVNDIKKENLITNPKMFDIQSQKIKNREIIQPINLSFIIQFSKAKTLYLCLGILSFFKLLLQIIIQRQLSKMSKAYSNFKQLQDQGSNNLQYYEQEMQKIQYQKVTRQNSSGSTLTN